VTAQLAQPRDSHAFERSLRAFATPAGVLAVLALDHRDAMRNAFKRSGVADVSEAAMLDVKCQIIEALAQSASGIMLDPCAVARCQPSGMGVILPLEAQGHEPVAGGRLTRLIEDFGPAEAAALGVQGCKLLLYYRADHAETAPRQRELASSVAADCHRHGLVLVVEPLVYRLADEDKAAYSRAFGPLVVAAAQDLTGSGADLLKLQFPGDAAYCERVSLATSPLDWTLLGGADVDGETFAEQLQIACDAGACGFIAGRAIWGGALALDADDQRKWLRRDARPLFERLTEIAHTHGGRIR
jgi:tagatose 1,6-diphosphate aldolase